MNLAYDITRLVSRLFSVTPNGIDRIDFALAQHFLLGDGERFGALATGLSPRLFEATASQAAIASIGAHWGEDTDPEDDPGYREVVARIAGETDKFQFAGRSRKTSRIISGRADRMRRAAKLFAEHGFSLGSSPSQRLPAGSRYLNVSQFPLWIPHYFDWLRRRRDVRAIFFIHDLLPLDIPEYFRSGELERHRRRIVNVARFGAGAIVTSETVRVELTEAMRKLGCDGFPILAAPIPAAAIFQTPRRREPRLADRPYFVCCGTIEPRKNHQLLLGVWRKIIKRDGAKAPKLVLIGARGWKYGPFTEALEQGPELQEYVIEVAGLTSPAFKRLLDNARALLMPSFAEGYGLPVREALAARIPVVASDIPAFREISDSKLHLVSPFDSEGWLTQIRALSERSEVFDFEDAPVTSIDNWARYFSKLESFVSAI
jgi:glycosyltransferase involved in cell wall biosynthesis